MPGAMRGTEGDGFIVRDGGGTIALAAATVLPKATAEGPAGGPAAGAANAVPLQEAGGSSAATGSGGGGGGGGGGGDCGGGGRGGALGGAGEWRGARGEREMQRLHGAREQRPAAAAVAPPRVRLARVCAVAAQPEKHLGLLSVRARLRARARVKPVLGSRPGLGLG